MDAVPPQRLTLCQDGSGTPAGEAGELPMHLHSCRMKLSNVAQLPFPASCPQAFVHSPRGVLSLVNDNSQPCEMLVTCADGVCVQSTHSSRALAPSDGTADHCER